MKLENQVCSLELAKRLKELGVKQVSVFYWNDGKLIIADSHTGPVKLSELYSAFTVAELGEMLPIMYHSWRSGNVDEPYYTCQDYSPTEDLHNQYAETEADARAKCLVYLLENKLMAAQETK